VKILAKYGYRPGPDGDNDEATIVKQQEESAVQEAPGAEINNSTMPTELNRIRELVRTAARSGSYITKSN
jgi:hypothetical protein